MDHGLTGRACVVSGGSRGIGLEVARRLHAEGADLLLLGRREGALQAAAGRLGPGARVELLALDITEPEAGDRVQQQWEVNVMAPMRTMRAAVPVVI
jgi:NAD(P)-dependent dehydrogenase (short-subunit alcohol dehydrogenase family)